MRLLTLSLSRCGCSPVVDSKGSCVRFFLLVSCYFFPFWFYTNQLFQHIMQPVGPLSRVVYPVGNGSRSSFVVAIRTRVTPSPPPFIFEPILNRNITETRFLFDNNWYSAFLPENLSSSGPLLSRLSFSAKSVRAGLLQRSVPHRLRSSVSIPQFPLPDDLVGTIQYLDDAVHRLITAMHASVDFIPLGTSVERIPSVSSTKYNEWHATSQDAVTSAMHARGSLLARFAYVSALSCLIVKSADTDDSVPYWVRRLVSMDKFELSLWNDFRRTWVFDLSIRRIGGWVNMLATSPPGLDDLGEDISWYHCLPALVDRAPGIPLWLFYTSVSNPIFPTDVARRYFPSLLEIHPPSPVLSLSYNLSAPPPQNISTSSSRNIPVSFFNPIQKPSRQNISFVDYRVLFRRWLDWMRTHETFAERIQRKSNQSLAAAMSHTNRGLRVYSWTVETLRDGDAWSVEFLTKRSIIVDLWRDVRPDERLWNPYSNEWDVCLPLSVGSDIPVSSGNVLLPAEEGANDEFVDGIPSSLTRFDVHPVDSISTSVSSSPIFALGSDSVSGPSCVPTTVKLRSVDPLLPPNVSNTTPDVALGGSSPLPSAAPLLDTTPPLVEGATTFIVDRCDVVLSSRFGLRPSSSSYTDTTSDSHFDHAVEGAASALSMRGEEVRTLSRQMKTSLVAFHTALNLSSGSGVSHPVHPHPSICDLFLHPESTLFLNRLFANFEVHRHEDSAWLMSSTHGHETDVEWHLLLPDIVVLFQIARCGWGPTLYAVALELVRCGTPFRTVTQVPALPVLPFVSDFRPDVHEYNYIPTAQEYMNWEGRVLDFLSGPKGRIALRYGGIPWRMAVMAMDLREALHGPDRFLCGDVYAEEQSPGKFLFDNALSAAELDFICGVFRIINCMSFLSMLT